MKTARQVTPEKLRGGFYTPPPLVRFCLERVAENITTGRRLRMLEPSVGDGAFIRGLRDTHLHGRIGEIVGLEVLDIEAEKARQALRKAGIGGGILTASAIDWAVDEVDRDFDVAVGNPPFVRFQFVERRDRLAADRLAVQLGLSFRGVSNLWIPLLLASISRLRPGGALGFVIPTECFTGCSAQVARDWLLRNVDGLRFDLFPPGSFPGVLQEIAIMSGVRSHMRTCSPQMRITEHSAAVSPRSWINSAEEGESWTRHLLEPKQLAALSEAQALSGVSPLSHVAAFEVSIVTGANGFFTVNSDTVAEYELARWACPLVPRIRHVEGLIYDTLDQDATASSGARSWLLNFDTESDDPEQDSAAARYLRLGESQLLHERYKCRIRSPWYRVPIVRRGELLLSKRSHMFPRLAVNRAGVFTTDTIYRGRILGDSATGVARAASLAATFHNSLTLLTAEIEGRSFGGGVLELVPSEVGRLSVPLVDGADAWLPALDAVLRTGHHDALIADTDRRLAENSTVPAQLLETLAEARLHMLGRRLARNAFDATEDGSAAWRNVA